MQNQSRILSILNSAISPYEDYCEGYGNFVASGNSYILGFVLSIGIVNAKFTYKDSRVLDEILAFDTAEVNSAYIGQINMSKVSSFCGPQGIVWGFDIYKKYKPDSSENFLFNLTSKSTSDCVDVYSLKPLQQATVDLFGTVEKLNFPLYPGSHVPCATKNIKVRDKNAFVYAGLAIGIPVDRQKHACLLMENADYIDLETFNLKYKDSDSAKLLICKNLAESILDIGKNQRVKYEKIFVNVEYSFVKEDQVACGLVAAPYFTIAKKAINYFNLKQNNE